jgi:hypothetical protein
MPCGIRKSLVSTSRSSLSSRRSRPCELAGNAFVLFAALLLLGSLATIAADPGAASFALGGLQFRKELRISMVSENLRFDDESEESDDGRGLSFKVTAEYEFLNNTNQAVTIPVAFRCPTTCAMQGIRLTQISRRTSSTCGSKARK